MYDLYKNGRAYSTCGMSHEADKNRFVLKIQGEKTSIYACNDCILNLVRIISPFVSANQ